MFGIVNNYFLWKKVEIPELCNISRKEESLQPITDILIINPL